VSCTCTTLPTLTVIDMGDHKEVLGTLNTVKDRGGRYWWLSVRECNVCGQWWLVAQEERINDIFCLRKLTQKEIEHLIRDNQWPSDFDRFESLLRIALQAGKRWRFADPMAASLLETAVDLATERPGIKVSEIAELLNLDRAHALEISKWAHREKGARFGFDD